MMPMVDKQKQKLWLLVFFLCLFNLIIFPAAVYAWSDPGLGPGVVQGTVMKISGGSLPPGTYKYNSQYDVKVSGSSVGDSAEIDHLPSYGGYAFITTSALSEAVSQFKGNSSHVSSNINLYTINPNNNKRYWIREVGYHSGADVVFSGKTININPSPYPTGNISTTPTIKAGQPVNINLSASSLTLSGIRVDYDKYKLDYKFKINGSQVDSGSASKNLSKQVNYTFPSPGKYTLTLELTDAFKRVAPPITKEVVVEAGGTGPPPVPPSGGKPLADFDMPSMTKPNTSVTITDRSQAYGGATITTRTWTITPSGYNGTPAGTSYSVSFPSEGTYTVKLVVKDSKGNTSDPCEKTIIVQGDFTPPDPPEPPPNGPPVAKMKYPKTVGIGKPAQIENLSYDTDGTIVDVDWDIDPQEGQKRSSIDDSGLDDNGGTVIFKEEGEYEITLTVEDDGGETASVSGTINVKNSPPKALISCPTDVMQGDDVVIKNRSYDPDGEIKEVKWTLEIPDGGVIKKSSDSSVVTQFTEDENRVYFDKEGTYKVTIEVTDDWGKKDSTTETIVVKPAIPNAYFEPVGPYKQNRKIVFTAGGTSPSRYPIITNQNEWVIEPVTSGLSADDIKVKLETPDNKGERVLLFKKPGQYRVKLKVTNTAGHTSEWYEKVYDIRPDEPPVADFNVQSAYLRNPEDSNVSEILIRDLSYSPDGDVITKRVWKYKFDSDNDGSFDDENFIVFDAANNPSPVIRTSHVGKYLVELEVTEGFGEPTGTLDEFISPEDYLKANTDNKPLQEKKTEVINVQPVVAFEAQRKKKVDIVFTVGDVDASKTSNLKGLITAYLESQLNSNNVQYGTIQAMETSTVTSQTAFPWVVYNLYHTGMGTGDGQFQAVDNSYRYRGYGSEAPIDHLYYDDGKNARREFTFNIDMTGYNACATVIPAFIFGADDKSGRFKGYIAMMWHDQVGVYYFDVTDHWQLARNGAGHVAASRNPSSFAGTTVTTVATKDTSLIKSFKMVYKSNVLEIYDGGTLLAKVNCPLAAGNGYGVAAVNSSHGCGARSYIQFNNFSLTTNTGVTLDEVLKNPLWREDAMHFLVNISDKQYEEFNDPVKAAYIYSKLLKDKVDFSVLGTTANQSQVNNIIAINDSNGTFIRNDNPNMEEAIKQISQYIINKVNTAMGGPTNYVLLNEEVEYKTYYNDYENDPEIAQRWMYEHDPNFFENSLGEATFNGQWIGSPVYRFDKVGKYLVDFQKRDNPTSDDRFDEYRLWSFSALDKLSLYVHRRPVGNFGVGISKSGSIWNVSYNSTAYDLDHLSQPDKGIVQHKWSWREALSAGWINGRPSTLADGKDYLIKYEVQDKEGAWSLPDVKLVSTRSINMPPVALFTVTPNPVVAGKLININDLSYSPTGKTIVSRSWRYQNPSGTWSSPSSTAPVSFSTVGTYKIELTVNDGIMSSEPYYQDIVVIPDNNPPTVSFTMTPATNFYDYEPVTYNISYSDPDGDPCGGYQWALQKNGGSWVYLSNPPANYEAYGPGNYVLALRAIDIPKHPQLDAKWSHPSSDPNTWFKRSFTVLEDFVMTGNIVPTPAERGRKIRIYAKAVRPNDYSTLVSIDSATATIIDTSTGKAPSGFTPTTISLAYDSSSGRWYGDYKIPEHISQKGKWPDDGVYDVIVTGTKSPTVKSCKIAFTVKGNILDRLITVTKRLN